MTPKEPPGISTEGSFNHVAVFVPIIFGINTRAYFSTPIVVAEVIAICLDECVVVASARDKAGFASILRAYMLVVALKPERIVLPYSSGAMGDTIELLSFEVSRLAPKDGRLETEVVGCKGLAVEASDKIVSDGGSVLMKRFVDDESTNACFGA